MSNRCTCLDSGVLVIVGGFCYFLIMGSYYNWASINIYACSYLMNQGDSSASVQSLFLVIPLNEVIITLAMPFGSYISQVYSPKLMILIGSIMISLGNFLASYMKSGISFVFFFAVFFGLGNGLSYMSSLQCVWKYYPYHKGFVGGIILSAIGFGSFLFSQISSHMINPSNNEPTLQVKTGRVNTFYYKGDKVRNFPHTLRVLAGIQLILGLIATFLV